MKFNEKFPDSKSVIISLEDYEAFERAPISFLEQRALN